LIVVSPAFLIRALSLKAPRAAELGRAHFAFAAFLIFFRPYVLTAHRAAIYITTLKDAARLLAYFAATLLIGALLAPVLFWAAQWLAAHQILSFLAGYDFEKFFHRALLIAAILLLWPLLYSLKIKSSRELGLTRNPHRSRDLLAGFLFAIVPLLCCAAILLLSHGYSIRHSIRWSGVGGIILASLFVPLIEELFFRGLILGVLLRSAPRMVAVVLTSALFAILHFLKTPEETSATVTWISGFAAMAESFDQFREPLLVLAGFTTLFLLGCVLAYARMQTRSLALPIGLHSGWIFAAGLFSSIARPRGIDLPWVGKSLLVGIVPLSVALLTWLLLRVWLNHVASRAT
jgi:membrane protease YdiL (CAAX protease family)